MYEMGVPPNDAPGVLKVQYGPDFLELQVRHSASHTNAVTSGHKFWDAQGILSCIREDYGP